MTPVRRTALAMTGYVLGLLVLFAAAFVFLGGVGANGPDREADTAVPASTEPTTAPPAAAPQEPAAPQAAPEPAAPEGSAPAEQPAAEVAAPVENPGTPVQPVVAEAPAP